MSNGNGARMRTDYTTMGKDDLMKLIQQLGFTAFECQLFLDTHPECKMALEKFHNTHDELAMATEAYTRLYGPLVAWGSDNDRWNWVDSPWPWHMDNGKGRKGEK